MGEPLGLREALESFASEPHRFLFRAFVEDEIRTPYTYSIIGLSSGVFLLEGYLTFATAAVSIEQIVAYLFVHHPNLMWPIAPFVHQGLLHFGANIGGLYVVSPLESEISWRQYVLLLVSTGFAPVYADGIKIDLFASTEYAAAYGISGFLYGLLGFGTVHLYRTCQRQSGLSNREWIIVLLGVSAVISVLVDVSTAFPDPLALNIGHLGGVGVGLLLSIFSPAESTRAS